MQDIHEREESRSINVNFVEGRTLELGVRGVRATYFPTAKSK